MKKRKTMKGQLDKERFSFDLFSNDVKASDMHGDLVARFVAGTHAYYIAVYNWGWLL